MLSDGVGRENSGWEEEASFVACRAVAWLLPPDSLLDSFSSSSAASRKGSHGRASLLKSFF